MFSRMSTKRFVCLLAIMVLTLGMAWAQDEKADADKGGKDKKKDLPLEPVRKIEFSTDEGTWLSLDVSPDGQKIIFELLGDLYELPISGGEAKRITEGMAFDSQPRYSPDGKWIAYISDHDGNDNLWIAKADGSEPRQLSKEKSSSPMSPAWMPDSQYALASIGGRSGLNVKMFHIDGGSGIEVTTPAADDSNGPRPGGGGGNLRHMGAQPSPDGRYLYFARRGPGSVYNQMSFEWEIYRRDMKSGDTDRVTQTEGGAIRPLISPDGKYLVYGTRFETQTGLRIRNLDTGTDRWLKYPIQRDDMESRGSRDLLPSYAFMPDGKEIVVTYGGKLHRVKVDSGDATEIPFTADVALDLGPLDRFQRRVDQGPVRSRLIFDPAQSPDGKTIAFSAMAHLYTMDLADKQPRRLTQGEAGEFKPAWSPDGQWVAYVTWAYNGEGNIWKARADGSGSPQRLTDVPAFYTDPVFSPDATRIVARRGNAWMRSQTPSEFGGIRVPTDLVWLPSGGGDVSLIVPARGLDTPHFGPEEDRIYFYAREGLISMRYDGSDRRTHIRITGKPNPRSPRPPAADDARISPDGKWVLAKVNYQLYAMVVPPPTGNTPSVNVFSPSVPAQRLTDIGADSYSWADDGKTVTWSVGSTFFRRPFDSIKFEPKQGGRGRRGGAQEGEESEASQEDKGEADKEAKDEEKFKALEDNENVSSYEVVIDMPRAIPEGTIVLHGATVITMNGDEVIQNGDVIVTNNRITRVGQRLRTPAGAHVVDVSGKYIVPGFVDTHAHYDMRTGGVLELHNWSFMANLAFGVTTGLDVQTSTNDYLAYLDMVQAGMMIGPRAYSTGPGVFSNNDFQSLEAAKHVLERYKKYYRNNNLKSYVVGNRKQRQWVVQAAHDLEITVTTEGALDLKLDSTHAIDGFGGNEHALPIVPLYNDVVQLFAQSQTSYTPTLLVLYGGPWAENYFYETTEVHDNAKLNRFTPHNEIDSLTKRRPWFRKDEHAFPKTAASALKVQRAGGLVGIGAHGQLQGLGYHWEMWALSMGGATPREVLKAATIDGAHIIGLGQDLGSIETGKLADMLVLDKNPLDDIHNTNTIRYVIKDGEIYEGDTLKKISPVEKEIAPFWWWSADPQK